MLDEERIVARKPSMGIHGDKHGSRIYESVRMLQAEMLYYHSPSTPTATLLVRPADGEG